MVQVNQKKFHYKFLTTGKFLPLLVVEIHSFAGTASTPWWNARAAISLLRNTILLFCLHVLP
jgi:hypothetical protein